jgi:hypothetical protein
MADKEAAPTTEEAIVVCLHPDVCRRGDSTVAYDIIARESDDVEHSTDVKITGCWASHEGARLKTVYQDAPGDAGIKSGCVEGYARPVKNTSPTVLVNGKPCVRHDTEFEMNCNGPDGPHNTTGRWSTERGGPSNVVGSDGMPVSPAPPIEGLSMTDQAMGFGKGVGNWAWGAVSGTLEAVGGASQYALDYMVGPFVDLATGGQGHPALPSGVRAREAEQQIGQGVAAGLGAVVDNPAVLLDVPGVVWDAMTAEVASLWSQGLYGEALGLASAEVASLLLPSTWAAKVKFLSKLDAGAIDDLVDRGVIDRDLADEARRAKQEPGSATDGKGDDGVLIHPRRVSPDDVTDAIKRLEERGIRFGQKHLFIEGTEGRLGVQDYVDLINSGADGLPLPWIDEAGVLADGHHMAVAMEITGQWNPALIQAAQDGMSAAASAGQLAGWRYGLTPFESISVMDAAGNIVRGAGAP